MISGCRIIAKTGIWSHWSGRICGTFYFFECNFHNISIRKRVLNSYPAVFCCKVLPDPDFRRTSAIYKILLIKFAQLKTSVKLSETNKDAAIAKFRDNLEAYITGLRVDVINLKTKVSFCFSLKINLIYRYLLSLEF